MAIMEMPETAFSFYVYLLSVDHLDSRKRTFLNEKEQF